MNLREDWGEFKKNGMYVEGGLKKALKNPFLQNLHQDITQCDKDGT